MRIIYLIFLMAFFTSSFLSCKKKDLEVMGKRPVFISYEDFSLVESQDPREFGELGKIVALGDFLFINEVRKGIHVIDNRYPADPRNILFWRIPGNRELIIIDNILYADNGKHLLLIDISDFENIQLVDHLKDVYEPEVNTEFFPVNYSGWFVCVNETHGIFNGWEEALLKNPKCRTK